MSYWREKTNLVVNHRKASRLWLSLNNVIGKVNLLGESPNRQMIEKGVTLKYLDITFDCSMSFKNQVDRIIIKCKNR